MRIAALVPRIGRMAFNEGNRFIQHVAWLEEGGLVDGSLAAVLQQALRRRLAEIFSAAPLHAFPAAGDMLAAVEATWGSPCGPLRKALEARLSYLLYNPSSDDPDVVLEELQRQHACVATLALRQLIGPHVCAAVSSRLRQWVQRAPLPQLGRHGPTLRAIVDVEPALLRAVAERLEKVPLQPLGPEQLGRFARVLADFEELGLPVLDEQQVEALARHIRTGVGSWPPERIAGQLELSGGLLRACSLRGRLLAELKGAITARLPCAFAEVGNSIACVADVSKACSALSAWLDVARRASACGALVLHVEAQRAIVENMTRRIDRCMDCPELATAVKEVETFEWRLLNLGAATASWQNAGAARVGTVEN